MALELKLSYSISADTKTLIVKDETGAYTLNNITGWGNPNTERNAVGLYCFIQYVPYDKPVENVIAISTQFDIDNTYNNTHQSEFQFNYNKDGWYKINLLAITQAEFDNLPEDPNDINLSEYNFVTVQDIILAKLIVQRNCQLEKYFECLQCNTCKCDILKEDLVTLETMIQATDYRFHSGKEFEAQKMTEKLTKQFKCCK